MAQNSLSYVEPKIAHILSSSDPTDIITTTSLLKRELQLEQVEIHKFNTFRKQQPVCKSNAFPSYIMLRL